MRCRRCAPRVMAELAAVQPAGTAVPGFFAASTGGLRARRFAVTPATRCGRISILAGEACRRDRGVRARRRSRGHRVSGAAPQARRSTDFGRDARHALALLTLLAEAEAHVHGTAVDDVHFHELGDWDSLMDLVAAGCIAGDAGGRALDRVGAAARRRSRANGARPACRCPRRPRRRCLTGYPWRDDGVAGERVTPTGAAILRHLVPASRLQRATRCRPLLSVGSGAGTRALPGLPNIMRALVFERAVPIDAAGADADVVSVLEFDVDDMTGEEIASRATACARHRRHRRVDRHARRQEGQAARGISRAGRPHAAAAIAEPVSPKPRRSGCACVTSAGSCCAARRSRWSTTAPRFASSSPNAPAGRARRRQRTTMLHRSPGSTGAERRAKRRYGAR